MNSESRGVGGRAVTPPTAVVQPQPYAMQKAKDTPDLYPMGVVIHAPAPGQPYSNQNQVYVINYFETVIL